MQILRKQSGTTMVEYAIIAPLLLLLVFATFDLSLLLWARMTLQYAVREGARYAVVDQENIGASPPCGDVIRVIQENSMGLTGMLHPAYELRINDQAPAKVNATGSSCPAAMFGNRGDLVELRLYANWPLLTPYLPELARTGFRFSVSATMRNEEN